MANSSSRNRLTGQRFSGDDDKVFAADVEADFLHNSVQECAKPQYCVRPDVRIDPKVATDIVRVICSNPKCTKSPFMHKDCFGNLEEDLANFLNAQQHGKQRNLSSSERFTPASFSPQAIWTAFRAQDLYCPITECCCQHGYLRKDATYIPLAARKSRRKSAEQRLPNSPGNNVPQSASGVPVFGTTSPSSLAMLNDNHSNLAGVDNSFGGTQQAAFRNSNSFGNKQQIAVSQTGYQRDGQQFVPQRGGAYGAAGSKNSGGRHRVPSLGGTSSQIVPSNARGDHRDRERQRAISLSFTSGGGAGAMQSNELNVAMSPTSVLSPTGSFPVQSVATPSSNQNERNSLPRFNGFEFFSNKDQAASGNIFARRTDMSAFARLHPQRLNAYSIKLEEDGPHGDDDTRYFVLNNLTAYRATSVECVLCGSSLIVYDRYPLIDGVFFLSPVDHTQRGADAGLGLASAHSNGPASGGNAQAPSTPSNGPRAFPVAHPADASRGTVYLHAICMMCTEGRSATVRCRDCNTVWDGRVLMLGSMYTYDVFAATICCRARLACNRCQKPVVDPNSNSVNSNFKYFSYFSKSHTCPHCGEQEAHFAKPLAQQFIVKRSVWN